jgi:hypothetical protein
MLPYIYNKGHFHKFMWINECSVGKAAENSIPADVSFLQWYFVLASTYPETSSEHKAVYRNVSISGQCTGTDSDPLVQSILIQQTDFQHPVIDGKASVVHGSGVIDHKAFFILRLAARFAVMFSDRWPRLDLIRDCPPALATLSRNAIPQYSELFS